jgi:hypothetical protein
MSEISGEGEKNVDAFGLSGFQFCKRGFGGLFA